MLNMRGASCFSLTDFVHIDDVDYFVCCIEFEELFMSGIFSKTALITIDLQKFILSMPLAPHSADELVTAAINLAQTVKNGGGILIRVVTDFSKDLADLPQSEVDSPFRLPPTGMPIDSTEIPLRLMAITPDVIIFKHQWSAFYGTDLDLQLRRRGIDKIILAGVATNFGVESTARDAWQHHYKVVIASEAVSSFSPELHDFAIKNILPRVSKIKSVTEIL